MESWKAKTIAAGVVLLIMSVLVFIIKVQNDMIARLKIIETHVVASKDLGDGLVRAQASYITKKDLETLIKQNNLDLKKIQSDMASLGADVRAMNTVTAISVGDSRTGVGSTSQTPRTDGQQPKNGIVQTVKDTILGKPVSANGQQVPPNYLTNVQWLKLEEPFSNGIRVPIGKTGFSAWNEKPWTVEVLPRTYSSVTVLGQDDEGRHFAYSKFQIKVDNQTFTPQIQSQIVEQYPDSQFRFDPRLYLSTDIGIATRQLTAEVMPGLGVSFFSYGRTKADPAFSFLTLGVGYATQTKEATLFLAPINYNLKEIPLPLIRNLQVGPAISASASGEIGLYIGMRVGL